MEVVRATLHNRTSEFRARPIPAAAGFPLALWFWRWCLSRCSCCPFVANRWLAGCCRRVFFPLEKAEIERRKKIPRKVAERCRLFFIISVAVEVSADQKRDVRLRFTLSFLIKAAGRLQCHHVRLTLTSTSSCLLTDPPNRPRGTQQVGEKKKLFGLWKCSQEQQAPPPNHCTHHNTVFKPRGRWLKNTSLIVFLYNPSFWGFSFLPKRLWVESSETPEADEILSATREEKPGE